MLRLDWNIVFTMINLVVLYFLLKKFLIGPILGIMNKREELISSQIANANRQEEEANQLKDQYEGRMRELHSESIQIVEKARTTATKEYEERLQEAEEEATRKVSSASQLIQMEKNLALKELQSEIANLAFVTARKVLGKEVTEEMTQTLYNQFLVEAGEISDEDRN